MMTLRGESMGRMMTMTNDSSKKKRKGNNAPRARYSRLRRLEMRARHPGAGEGNTPARSSRLRRQRGYSFERWVADVFNEDGWYSVRLGAPSIELPDVFCINNASSSVVAAECKSTRGDRIVVSNEQIRRCRDWVGRLEPYEHRHALVACLFAADRENDRMRHTVMYDVSDCDHENGNLIVRRNGVMGFRTDSGDFAMPEVEVKGGRVVPPDDGDMR